MATARAPRRRASSRRASSRRALRAAGPAVLALAVMVSACSPPGSAESPASAPTSVPATASPPLAECAPPYLTTVNPGVLVVGTSSATELRSLVDEDPSNDGGFGSAIASAVAEGLGFSPGQVRWVLVPRVSAPAEGDEPFDLAIAPVPVAPDGEAADPGTLALPAREGDEQLGLVFAPGNPLIGCVDEVLGVLADSGELEAIQDEWLPGTATP